MKTAILIRGDITQLVLTPETAWETAALSDLKDGQTVEIKRGSFYFCKGGWEKEGSTDDSVLIRIGDKLT